MCQTRKCGWMWLSGGLLLLLLLAGCLSIEDQLRIDTLMLENQALVLQIKEGNIPWKEGLLLLDKNRQEIKALTASNASYAWWEIAVGVGMSALAAFTGIRLHRGPSHRKGIEVLVPPTVSLLPKSK